MQDAKANRISQFHPKKARCPIQAGIFNLQQGIQEISRHSAPTLASTRLMWSDGSESDVTAALDLLTHNLGVIRFAIEEARGAKRIQPDTETNASER